MMKRTQFSSELDCLFDSEGREMHVIFRTVNDIAAIILEAMTESQNGR